MRLTLMPPPPAAGLSLDLLVAAIALHHNAELVSFAADFVAIASVIALRLNRPAAETGLDGGSDGRLTFRRRS